MSDLLNQASLVYVPSGYKEDTAYTVIPTDGSGDLTFTRASDGTRVNSQGYVERVPWNLVQYSEQFNNAFHFPFNLNAFGSGSVANTTATVDPNGSNFADYIQENTSASVQHSIIDIFSGNVSGTTYTWSVFAKAAQRTIIQLANNAGGGGQANFNLTTGVASLSSGVSASMQDVGNGWYRCVLSYTSNTSGNHNVQIRLCDASGNATYTGNGTSGVYIWGAQLVEGSTAKPYFPTTDRLNVPRLDYSNGCPSLLLEKQSTNLLTYSEDFSTTRGWFANTIGGSTASFTADYGISPDGTQNADRIQLALNGGGYADWVTALPLATTIGTTYTYSIWIKALSGTPTLIFLGIGVIGNQTITTTGDWVRYTYTFTALATDVYPRFLIQGGTSSTVDILAWGYQLEASSYATSYIPTTSSSATRVADACYKTGISSLIGQTEGVVFADFVWEGSTTGSADYPISIYGSSYSDFVGLNTYENTNSMYVYVGGSNVVSISGTTFVNGQRYKIAMAYKANDFVYYLNGTQMGTDTSGSVPSSMANFQTVTPFSNKSTSQKYNEIILFPTRLTNSELAQLTTI